MPGNNPKKVERITPSAQSEIDKKSYRDLDQDFVTAELSSRLGAAERTERTPEKKRRIGDKVRYFERIRFWLLQKLKELQYQSIFLSVISSQSSFKILILLVHTFRS